MILWTNHYLMEGDGDILKKVTDNGFIDNIKEND